MERWSSLEHLKICEVKKGTSTLKALYRGRKWVGILPLKILGKTSAVGLVSYWLDAGKIMSSRAINDSS